MNHNKLTYRKIIAFTEQQHNCLLVLESYNVNVNNFIRSAIKEKLHRDWEGIKEQQQRCKCPF